MRAPDRRSLNPRMDVGRPQPAPPARGWLAQSRRPGRAASAPWTTPPRSRVGQSARRSDRPRASRQVALARPAAHWAERRGDHQERSDPALRTSRTPGHRDRVPVLPFRSRAGTRCRMPQADQDDVGIVHRENLGVFAAVRRLTPDVRGGIRPPHRSRAATGISQSGRRGRSSPHRSGTCGHVARGAPGGWRGRRCPSPSRAKGSTVGAADMLVSCGDRGPRAGHERALGGQARAQPVSASASCALTRWPQCARRTGIPRGRWTCRPAPGWRAAGR